MPFLWLEPEGAGLGGDGKDGSIEVTSFEPIDATTLAEFAIPIRWVFTLRTGRSVAGGFVSFMVFPFRGCFVGDRKEAPDMALHPSEFAFVFRHPDSFAHFIVAEN